MRPATPLWLPAALCFAAAALAQPNVENAQRAAEAARDAASAAARDAATAEQRLAERRVELARQVLEAERAEAAARAAAAAAAAATVVAETEAAARAAALRPLWPVVRRLALWPAETLLAAPVPPADALRGLALLQGVWRQLTRDAEAARQAAAAASTQADIARAVAATLEAAVATARATVAVLEPEIEAATARRLAARDAETAAIARAAAAASRARGLEAAIERLARPAEPPAEPAAPPRQAARGAGERPASGAPVAGSLIRSFGEAGPGGPARGHTFAAPPGARVITPCGGRTVFAGPFRGYGRLVIVDCGAGVHAVLGGLGRLDTAAGDRLLAGEPVGLLPTDAAPRLYLELRRDGEPADPRPFLAGRG